MFYIRSSDLIHLFWGPFHTACGILVLSPGIEPEPPAWEAQSLNHWTIGEVSDLIHLIAEKFVPFYQPLPIPPPLSPW